MSVLLFAYGSNMAAGEIEAFAPDARFLGAARLPGRRFELRRRSIRWGGGAADIVEAPGDEVWGALYELPDGAEELLDAKEGVGFAYRRTAVEVELNRERRVALAYEVAAKEPEEVPPTRAYAALITRAARERGLPEHYRRRLLRSLGS